ncbi:MAG: RDD family protein [Sphingobacteriia bacterium]|nr:MAG: RDD family protein [Sphingobacteriia bacterium]
MKSSIQCPSFATQIHFMKKVGDGTRALNFFIDTILISLLAMLLFRWWNWYVVYWNYKPYHFGWFFFPTIFVYYLVLESIFAKTIGKRFTHSKVVSKKGGRASFPAIIFRSLVRLTIIDLFFGPFLDGPLHDYASGTTVVQDE